MNISVRAARRTDKQRCMALLAALTDTTGSTLDDKASTVFDALLDAKRGQVLVAEDDGVVLGLASVSYNLAMRYGGEYCQLEELMVDRAARGMNVGGLLMAEVIERAKRRGCAACGLYLLASTEHNRAFYEKYGFKITGTNLRMFLE